MSPQGNEWHQRMDQAVKRAEMIQRLAAGTLHQFTPNTLALAEDVLWLAEHIGEEA